MHLGGSLIGLAIAVCEYVLLVLFAKSVTSNSVRRAAVLGIFAFLLPLAAIITVCFIATALLLYTGAVAGISLALIAIVAFILKKGKL